MNERISLNTIYNEDRPLSWSAISSFEWNPRQWYEKYVLKIKPIKTPELAFGSMVDERIQSDKKFLPHLERFPIMQHRMTMTFNGIPLVGVADHFDPGGKKGPRLKDDKTGRKPWDQKRADETGQLTLYTFFLYETEKIKPEDLRLSIDWLPTHIKGGEIAFIEPNHRKLIPVTIHTRRTMHDILKFGQRINETYAAMEEYMNREHEAPHVRVKNPVSKMFK